MSTFRVSLEDLLAFSHQAANMTIPQRLLFFESGEAGWIHYVPRLLVILEGQREIRYIQEGRELFQTIEAPAIFYCAKSGYLLGIKDAQLPNKSLSFSFYPTYIRAMMVDYDGITPPPTERDVYYHTSKPLSLPGVKLLELFDALHEANCDENVKQLLPLLLELTIRDLESSSSAPVLKVRKLWDEINTFLREHREENLSRDDIAKLFRISPVYVSELCRKYSNDNFSHLKLKYQLEHARNLLLNTRLNLEEIAERSGFSSANYFIRRFKVEYGTTPHVFRSFG